MSNPNLTPHVPGSLPSTIWSYWFPGNLTISNHVKHLSLFTVLLESSNIIASIKYLNSGLELKLESRLSKNYPPAPKRKKKANKTFINWNYKLGKKMLAAHPTGRVLSSLIYKESLWIAKKKNNWVEKLSKPVVSFTEEGIQMDFKPLQHCSTAVMIAEIQI